MKKERHHYRHTQRLIMVNFALVFWLRSWGGGQTLYRHTYACVCISPCAKSRKNGTLKYILLHQNPNESLRTWLLEFLICLHSRCSRATHRNFVGWRLLQSMGVDTRSDFCNYRKISEMVGRQSFFVIYTIGICH